MAAMDQGSPIPRKTFTELLAISLGGCFGGCMATQRLGNWFVDSWTWMSSMNHLTKCSEVPGFSHEASRFREAGIFDYLMLQCTVSEAEMLPSSNMTLAWINSPAIPASDVHYRGISVPAMNGMWGENFTELIYMSAAVGTVSISVQRVICNNKGCNDCKSSKRFLCPIYMGNEWIGLSWTFQQFQTGFHCNIPAHRSLTAAVCDAKRSGMDLDGWKVAAWSSYCWWKKSCTTWDE